MKCLVMNRLLYIQSSNSILVGKGILLQFTLFCDNYQKLAILIPNILNFAFNLFKKKTVVTSKEQQIYFSPSFERLSSMVHNVLHGCYKSKCLFTMNDVCQDSKALQLSSIRPVMHITP